MGDCMYWGTTTDCMLMLAVTLQIIFYGSWLNYDHSRLYADGIIAGDVDGVRAFAGVRVSPCRTTNGRTYCPMSYHSLHVVPLIGDVVQL